MNTGWQAPPGKYPHTPSPVRRAVSRLAVSLGVTSARKSWQAPGSRAARQASASAWRAPTGSALDTPGTRGGGVEGVWWGWRGGGV